jgi:hypothetical protein
LPGVASRSGLGTVAGRAKWAEAVKDVSFCTAWDGQNAPFPGATLC